MKIVLVGIFEISEMAGVTPQAVSNWSARKPDFPKPLATLASGPVWDGKAVERWLSSNRTPSRRSEKMNPLKAFRKGRDYTVDEISAVVGGEPQSYLPQVEGQIVCARLTKDMNPNVPYEVLVGDLPRVVAKAKLLVEQGSVIPVFIKEAPNQWRYHGPMTATGYQTDRSVVDSRAEEADREDIAGLLTLKDC